jgi:hypothetical protein
MQHGDRLGYRKTPKREYEMTPSKGANMFFPINLCPEPVHPCARCVDYRPRSHFSRFAGEHISYDYPAYPISTDHKAVSRRVIKRKGPMLLCFMNGTEHQPSIVGDSIFIPDATLEAVGRYARHKHE